MTSMTIDAVAPMHRAGIGLSALCLVHCLALPWILASLPLVLVTALPEAVRDTEWLHAMLLLPVVLISGPVLLRGQPGRARFALVLGALGLLAAALFVDSDAGEQALTIAGAATLMAAHWAMLRRGHRHAEAAAGRDR